MSVGVCGLVEFRKVGVSVLINFREVTKCGCVLVRSRVTEE